MGKPPRKTAGQTPRSRPAMALSCRQLNRALLARQMLIERRSISPAKALEHLVGLQAQSPMPPYFGLWTRLAYFRPETLARLIETRKAVRIPLMRSTIHLVTARDCIALRPVVQSVQESIFFVGSRHGRNVAGVDMKKLLAIGRAFVEEEPRTFKELGERLQQEWPDRDPQSLAYAVRCQIPLVQVPPRGVWGKGGPPAHTTAEAWLGRPIAGDPSPDDMLMRYLAAFGPASVLDMQAWSGLTQLADTAERLRSRLKSFRDEAGRELFDLPRAPRPDPDRPVPVRFLPEFDNVLLSHADRTRIVSDADRKRLFGGGGMLAATILVDGFVHGTWRIERGRRTATLAIAPFRPLAKHDVAALKEEGGRLLEFAAVDADRRDVRILPPA
jgi:hypothetical protein